MTTNEDKQKYLVSLQFEYEGDVFDGDPTDAWELCNIEREYLLNHKMILSALVADADDIVIYVDPILGDSS